MSKIKHTALVVLVAAMAASAHAQTPPDGAPSFARATPKPSVLAVMRERYAEAKTTYPSAEVMATLYPPRARDDKKEGMVTLACTVAPSGHLSSCDIVNQWPAGYGFGTAYVKALLKYYTVDPTSVEGGIQPGDFEFFTYQWTLGE